jgi:para-nitrobenzyl esterase
MFGVIDRTPPAWPRVPATPSEAALSDAMIDYWTSFARSGEPRAASQPPWPAYGANRAYMAFADAARPGTRLFPGMYELHEEALCRRRASGTIPWNWKVGVASPVLPARGEPCR